MQVLAYAQGRSDVQARTSEIGQKRSFDVGQRLNLVFGVTRWPTVLHACTPMTMQSDFLDD
jgi:hypothetical protein